MWVFGGSSDCFDAQAVEAKQFQFVAEAGE
jgi:hypothetical protein